MINAFDDFQKFSKDNADVAMESANVVTKGLQTIASEAADYSKQSFEASAKAFEKILGAGTLDKAVEAQTDYVRSAYEGYVGQATKVGEIFTGMAQAAYKPYEGLFGKLAK